MRFLTILLTLTVSTLTYGEECEIGPNGKCMQEMDLSIKTKPKLRLDDITGNCEDADSKCQEWAEMGECRVNPFYMLFQCRKTCNTCDRKRSDGSMGTFYGVDQVILNEADAQRLKQTDTYMETFILNETMSHLVPICQNENKDCTHWAQRGECEKLPAYMLTKCAPACQSCHMLDMNQRCPFDPNAPGAVEAGGITKVFERVIEKYGSSVNVLSSPSQTFNNRPAPWIITIDDFLNEQEAQHIIELGYKYNFTRSSDVGRIKADGTMESKISANRTSETTWCTKECHKDPVITKVEARLEDLLGIDIGNSEYLQILKYQAENNGKYGYHHDYIQFHKTRSCGVRILTAYFYLNDVEAGGGTQFTDMGLVVMPKRGRLLLWPSVYDDQPQTKDPATHHEALPVEAGKKFGINAWIHYRNFREPYEVGCT